MKKYISLVLSAVFILSVIPLDGFAKSVIPNAPVQTESEIANTKYNKDDVVSFIVEVEGNPVLSGSEAAAMGTDFLATDNARLKEAAILKAQDIIVDSIENKTNTDIKPDTVYTLLFNGFAIKAPYGDMEKIKNIDGVKGVYVSEDIKLEPHLSDTADIVGTTSEALGGYTGRGQLVAVIDTEFDVKHPFFATAPENPKFETAQDVAEFLKDKTLSFSISPTQAFVNKKIPFAYDYGEGDTGDYDLFSSNLIHGTHVAGIIGGKGGLAADGSELNGIAPDSQLVLMKVTDENGDFNITGVFSALEDAVRLGVCAVNCSFGASYISADIGEIWQRNFSAVEAAGVHVISSAGNSYRGFYNSGILTENIDYSSQGVPAAISTVMSVAASDKKTADLSQIASFSSYGVTENLELSPDITAPGVSIYSSVPNGKYQNKSGTSMAAPGISGVVAVMNEYFDINMAEVTGEERVELIENILMSTADVLYQSSNGVPYTPRVQGAGRVNAEAAVRTSAILVSNLGKSKISLGDDLTSEIDISFTAKNLTNKEATYDRLTLNVLTDGYTTSYGNNYVSKSVALNVVSHTLPGTITLAANESKDITAKIVLENRELAENLKIFTNGFFIDGFISYEDTSGTIPHIGIPFMGFYGDWTKATVFDSTVYDEGGSKLDYETKRAYKSFIYSKESGGSLGSNGAGGYDSKYIALSPNGDGANDSFGLQFTPMRTISYIESNVIDKNGTLYNGPTYSKIYNKFFGDTIDLNDMTGFDDGKYTLKLNALYNYEKENPTVHTMEIPFYIDTKKPEIIKAVPNGDIIDVTFKDDNHVSYAYTYYEDADGKEHIDIKHVENPTDGGEVTLSFNLADIGAQDASYEDIYIFVHDKAENNYGNSLICVMGDIHPLISDFTYLNGIYTMDINFINYKAEQSCAVIVAFYNSSGELIHMDKKDSHTLPNGSSTLEFKNFADLDSATRGKIFIWDSMTGINPIDISKAFRVN